MFRATVSLLFPMEPMLLHVNTCGMAPLRFGYFGTMGLSSGRVCDGGVREANR